MSSNSLTAIDLSLLAPPDVVKTIQFETILQELLDKFYQEMRVIQPDYPDLLESDPAMKLAEVASYREMLVRQDANDQARSVLLAYAEGADLDHKAAERNLQRRLISPATESSPAVYESNESLRKRVQLAPEGQTTAGSEGSYIFHGLNADPRVKDIYPYAPLDEDNNPTGICNIYVLSTEGAGEASEELLNIVDAALNAKSVRPLTDKPIVYSASILNYSIEAEIFIDEGPDENIILSSCYQAAEEYTQKSHAFNGGVSLSGIYQALHQPGVSRVNLISPAGNIDTSLGQVAYCTGINITRATA
ncbi:baseplate assembly protein [Acinetobacter schindleri]|uniref:baseplate assembly protein n=1 Tax=Acinetobacter schindleri TaxID=108981 RepID=UPI00160FC7F0|nr:baseplate J/gp47 family protein [Acinetobacter schindleri]MBB4835466.1 phage-related baseplate assembly protein [Acinetobacter schindleri]